jgi:hypothetical protein
MKMRMFFSTFIFLYTSFEQRTKQGVMLDVGCIFGAEKLIFCCNASKFNANTSSESIKMTVIFETSCATKKSEVTQPTFIAQCRDLMSRQIQLSKIHHLLAKKQDRIFRQARNGESSLTFDLTFSWHSLSNYYASHTVLVIVRVLHSMFCFD